MLDGHIAPVLKIKANALMMKFNKPYSTIQQARSRIRIGAYEACNSQGSWAVIYDAGLKHAPGLDEFSVDYWRSRQAVSGEATGRGSAWFIETPDGPVVLRHFLRGGWAAKLSRQAYFFTGISKSRPFREYHILAGLYEKGLPVPRPVAALCQHKGLVATGAIMTACIPSATTLADVVAGAGEIAKVFGQALASVFVSFTMRVSGTQT